MIRLDQRWERRYAHGRLYHGAVKTHRPPDYQTTARLVSIPVWTRLTPFVGRGNPTIPSMFISDVAWRING